MQEEPGGGFLLLVVFSQGETVSSERELRVAKSATDHKSMNSSRRGHRTQRGGIFEIISAADLKSLESKQWVQEQGMQDTGGSSTNRSSNSGSSSLSPQFVICLSIIYGPQSVHCSL